MAVEEPIRTGTIEQPLQTAPNTSLTTEELQWGQYCHFAGMLFIPPVIGYSLGSGICYFMKKDTSPYLKEQGRTALNFHLTNLIFMLICVPLIAAFGLGLVGIAGISLYGFIMALLNGMKAKDGTIPKYPFSFNLIK